MWCIDQFYILFWILLESGTAYCLSWRYLHWLDIEIVYCVFDVEKLILSKWWEHTAETLGEEFKLAESIWWGEATTLWVWTMRCIGIVRTMAIFSRLICLRCFGIVRTIPIPTSSSSWPMDHTFDLMLCILPFLRRLWLSLWGWHCIEATLVYNVVQLLRWSKDFSDTTVSGWPTLTMSNRTFYSTLKFEAVRCYLYVESWFGEGTLCSDYVLYPEEGCTDTLCKSLRSWEVSQQAD